MHVYSLAYGDVDPDVLAHHLDAITAAVQHAALARVTTPREVTWRKPSEQSPVLLHFDDLADRALAIADRLERAGWHGWFHVATDRVGRAGAITAPDVRELSARGHVIALRLDRGSDHKGRLEDVIGAPVEVASVASRACPHRVVMAAEHAGFHILFTSQPTSRCDWVLACLVLGRYAIGPDTSAEEAARIAGAGRLPRWEQWASWFMHGVGDHWRARRQQPASGAP